MEDFEQKNLGIDRTYSIGNINREKLFVDARMSHMPNFSLLFLNWNNLFLNLLTIFSGNVAWSLSFIHKMLTFPKWVSVGVSYLIFSMTLYVFSVRISPRIIFSKWDSLQKKPQLWFTSPIPFGSYWCTWLLDSIS